MVETHRRVLPVQYSARRKEIERGEHYFTLSPLARSTPRKGLSSQLCAVRSESTNIAAYHKITRARPQSSSLFGCLAHVEGIVLTEKVPTRCREDHPRFPRSRQKLYPHTSPGSLPRMCKCCRDVSGPAVLDETCMRSFSIARHAGNP